MLSFDYYENFLDTLLDRFRTDLALNRSEDLTFEIGNEGNTVPEVDSTTTPKVVAIDFQAKANAAKHHCERYEIIERRDGAVVIRRGGTLSIEVEFNVKPEFKNTHEVKLLLSFGQRPSVLRGTQASLVVSGKKEFDKSNGEWDVRVAGENGNKVTFEIQVPTHALVGVWKPVVEIALRSGPEATRHSFRSETLLYILFNPWNKDDGTYMADDEKRQEYVLSDVGKIWVGNYPYSRGRKWVFGQFDDAVLPASVLLLERSGLPVEDRGDPIRVSRIISKMVNSNDEGGVIIGRWDGEYEDGTPPSTWSGSIKILEEYIRSNRPVKYGQCWVFAGVVNTVCRALGLPARVVSNFSSAHDTNESLSIEVYLDEEGTKIKSPFRGARTPDGFYDSIWNFHVWNDVWMTRPDLSEEYNGWQAIDATPQEPSSGVFQLGPASHEAIRRGHIEKKFDVSFVLAEVNADVIYWQKDDKAPTGFRKLMTNKTTVGRQLLTKKPGPLDDSGFFERDREDVTLQYKARERTAAEREALLTAAGRIAPRFGPGPPILADAGPTAVEDVEFTFEDLERVAIGQTFTVKLTAKSKSDAQRTIKVVITCSSMFYTGDVANSIKRLEQEIVLAPGEAKTTSLDVNYGDYYEKLVEHALVKNVAICNVKETSYAWVGDDTLEVQKPDIVIEVLGEAVSSKPLNVRFSFVNPLPIPLRECKLVVDGPGLVRPKEVTLNNVGANQRMVHEMMLHPKRLKVITLVATFNSRQLVNLTGSKQIEIK